MKGKIRLHENTATEQLRRLSNHLGGDFIEGYGTAKCVLDNELAKGSIRSYDLIAGLAVRTYNVTFFEELRFSKDESELDPLYFLFSLKGVCFHKFGNEQEPVKLQEKQNIILRSGTDTTNEVILPAGIHLEIGVIFLTERLMSKENQSTRPLEAGLREVFRFLNNKTPFRYLGEINMNVSKSATILIENKRTDIIGRMITEAAVMNTIAEQIKGFESGTKEICGNLGLTKTELSKIAGIGDFIKENLSRKVNMDIVKQELGMSPNKVQKGIRHLFGQTFNQFLQALRLEQARKYLLISDMNISQISSSVGVSSKSYFSRKFYERFGVLPSEYRQFLQSDNMLFELSYRSKGRADLSQMDIKNIVETSRRHNSRSGISGCLIYHKNIFFQILEGPKSCVLKLMRRIQSDRRHSEIEILWKGPKSGRIFAEWDMALVSEKGNVDLPVEGNSKEINISNLAAELKEPSIASEMLWRRVRNIVKATG